MLRAQQRHGALPAPVGLPRRGCGGDDAGDAARVQRCAGGRAAGPPLRGARRAAGEGLREGRQAGGEGEDLFSRDVFS